MGGAGPMFRGPVEGGADPGKEGCAEAWAEAEAWSEGLGSHGDGWDEAERPPPREGLVVPRDSS